MAQACPDESERAERLHKSRYLRTWTDTEGAFRLDARLAPEMGAEVRVTLDLLKEELFQESRRKGLKEPYQALDADALVEMARGARGARERAFAGPKAMVSVRVDRAALLRGHTKSGEVYEVAGIGPISVATARSLASDSILKVLVCKATEVKAVAHYGRTISSKLRTLLIETYPQCAIEGCHDSKRLEIDHVIPLPKGPTSPENLIRICTHHHRLKTHRGFRLVRLPGNKARLEPPKLAPSRASPDG